MLAAGHGGGGIVENDDHTFYLIIGGIDKAGDAGMHKGRIADDADDFFARLCAADAFVDT